MVGVVSRDHGMGRVGGDDPNDVSVHRRDTRTQQTCEETNRLQCTGASVGCGVMVARIARRRRVVPDARTAVSVCIFSVDRILQQIVCIAHSTG